MKKRLLGLIAALCWTAALWAQADSHTAAVKALREMAARYRNTPLLGFNVEYKYAAEAQPGIYLDSTKGSIKLSGSRYWYQLDSTEVICGNKFIVVLYREDKIMYLTTPATGSATANPLALMDSLLFNAQGLQFSISVKGDQQLVTIVFEKKSPYKKIDYYINSNNGFLSKMVSTVNAEQLYDPSVRARLTNEQTYAVVETWFTNYRMKGFDETVFDTGRYFKKQGGEYITLAPYDTYKIFLGSTGL